MFIFPGGRLAGVKLPALPGSLEFLTPLRSAELAGTCEEKDYCCELFDYALETLFWMNWVPPPGRCFLLLNVLEPELCRYMLPPPVERLVCSASRSERVDFGRLFSLIATDWLNCCGGYWP